MTILKIFAMKFLIAWKKFDKQFCINILLYNVSQMRDWLQIMKNSVNNSMKSSFRCVNYFFAEKIHVDNFRWFVKFL
jgi:uncharacterized membrane-anchored protein YitT (DUF2179 family)